MKSYELLPTEENLIDFFVKDAIKRNKDIANFYKILQCQEQQSAIAIDGRWGSGKTFFVHQTKMIISAFNSSCNMKDDLRKQIISKLSKFNVDQNTETSIISVYYDAWENDNDTEPILSLIYEITKQLSVDFSLSDKSIVDLASVIIEMISGKNVKKIKDVLTSEDPFTKLKIQKNIEDKIKQFLTDLLRERANRLVIFIDELDRCSAVANILRLLNLPKRIQDAVIEGTLSAGHARVLAGIDDAELQSGLFAKTMQFGWSVRQLEAAAKNAQTEKKEKPEPVAPPIEYEELTERLRRATGLKVKLEGTQEKGKIVLQYTSEEELQRLWEWMEK